MDPLMNNEHIDLDLNPSIVERLTAQQHPFLFIDRIIDYRHELRPKL